MLLVRQIENRHILWTALSMVAIGLIVPGGFGVKPPQWFHDRPPEDVASLTSVESDTMKALAPIVPPEKVSKANEDLPTDAKTQQVREPAQPSSFKANTRQTKQVTVPLKFARHIPAKHFENTAKKTEFVKISSKFCNIESIRKSRRNVAK